MFEKWYHDKERLFYRDKRSIMKAIARYGYVCHERGWTFDEFSLCQQLLRVLQKIDGSNATYLPVFLEAAIDSHVRQRAEEIKAQSEKERARKTLVKSYKSLERMVVPDQLIVEKSATEVLAALYKDLSKKKPKANAKQLSLI